MTGQAPGIEKHLNLTGPTYLGSWPSSFVAAAGAGGSGRRPTPSPLDGCLRNLELEDLAVSLVSPREPLLLEASEVGECDQHPCTSLPCRHGGECRGDGGGGRINCSCDSGYYGERCGARRSVCRPNPCEGGGRCTTTPREQVSFRGWVFLSDNYL